MKFYIVTAKCGHVGKGYYIPIDFPQRACSKKEAAKAVRNFPRVKHHHKDAILCCREVSENEYNEQVKKNREDSYLSCHSSTEQRFLCCLENRLIAETKCEQKRNRDDRVAFKLKKHRILKEEYLRQCQFI